MIRSKAAILLNFCLVLRPLLFITVNPSQLTWSLRQIDPQGFEKMPTRNLAVFTYAVQIVFPYMTYLREGNISKLGLYTTFITGGVGDITMC